MRSVRVRSLADRRCRGTCEPTVGGRTFERGQHLNREFGKWTGEFVPWTLPGLNQNGAFWLLELSGTVESMLLPKQFFPPVGLQRLSRGTRLARWRPVFSEKSLSSTSGSAG